MELKKISLNWVLLLIFTSGATAADAPKTERDRQAFEQALSQPAGSARDLALIDYVQHSAGRIAPEYLLEIREHVQRTMRDRLIQTYTQNTVVNMSNVMMLADYAYNDEIRAKILTDFALKTRGLSAKTLAALADKIGNRSTYKNRTRFCRNYLKSSNALLLSPADFINLVKTQNMCCDFRDITRFVSEHAGFFSPSEVSELVDWMKPFKRYIDDFRYPRWDEYGYREALKLVQGYIDARGNQLTAKNLSEFAMLMDQEPSLVEQAKRRVESESFRPAERPGNSKLTH